MKYFFFTTLLISCFSLTCLAQNNILPCYTDQYRAQQMQVDPDFAKTLRKQENIINNYLRNHEFQNAGKTEAVKVIPVVFHIFHQNGSENISDAQVEDQIRILNEDYAGLNPQVSSYPLPDPWKPILGNLQVEFRLAKKDPNGNPTNGIVKYNSTADWVDEMKSAGANWPSNKYLQVWTCNTLRPPQSPGGKILGFTDSDGVIVRSDQVGNIGTAVTAIPQGKGSTVTHEIGHWLGLYHIWGATDCGDDKVSDTPPQATAWRGKCGDWPARAISPTCGQVDNGPNGDMFMNFMDYSTCRFMFTKGQCDRMSALLNGTRSNLWSPANLKATGVDGTSNLTPVANFTASTQQICGSGTVKFTDQSTNSPTSWSWSFPGGTPSSSTQQNPSVAYSTSGTHNVSLTVSNNNGSDAKTVSGYIAVSSTGKSLPVFEGFEGSFPPSGWTIGNSDGKITWAKASLGKGSSGSAYVNNFNYDQANGEIDELIMPAVNLTAPSGKIELRFDVAYATYSPLSDGYSDRLEILVSTDCGVTYNSIYDKKGSELITVSSNSEIEFKPKDGQWRYEKIDISKFNGSKNALIKFKHTTDWENNLYIDNINLSPVIVGVEENEEISDRLNIFPNPLESEANISLELHNNTTVDLKIYDISGQVIYTEELTRTKGHHQIKLDRGQFCASGMYFVHISTNNGNYSKKLMVK